jgi:hypothetical protein
MHQFLDLLLFAVDIVAIDASMMPTILPQAPDINETYIHNFTEISEYTYIYIYSLVHTLKACFVAPISILGAIVVVS